MKRFTSLSLALVLLLGCLCAVVPASAATKSKYPVEMYVKTGNGKTLNVRDIETNKVIARLDYGSKVMVESIKGDWAYLIWGSLGSAKVMKKFLVSKKPPKYEAPEYHDSPLSSETVNGMNTQYALMKYVESYTVITVPATRTSTVNLRWGPSSNTKLVQKVPADYELTVLAESSNWLLCSDPKTNAIVYVARKFTNAK